MRDKNGGYKLDIPVLAPVVDQDGEGEEMEGVDGGGGGGGGNEAEISGCEKQSMLCWTGFEVGFGLKSC